MHTFPMGKIKCSFLPISSLLETPSSPAVEDDEGIQLRKKWYKGKFLVLGTTFNGQQHIQNPKKSIVGKNITIY